MLLEGILVHKQPYKERDIIASFLLRTGEVLSGYLYGGQGGGKNMKSDLLQLGYAFRFKAHDFKNKTQAGGTYKLSEWSILWQHEKIRNDYSAFVLMHYICELHHKLSPGVNDLSELGSGQSGHIFTCLSNTLFLLDQNLEKKREIKKIMLGKLIYFLGVLPDAQNCCFCTKSLSREKSFLFYEEGQASCTDCLGEAGNHPGAWVVAGFYQRLNKVLQDKFQVSLTGADLDQIDDVILEKYLWQHFQLKKESFKSLTWQS